MKFGRFFREKGRRVRGWLYTLSLRAVPMALNFPENEDQASREFSIIVPIHDAPDVTGRCLLSLERYASSAEVILVDDGSEGQETRELIRSFEYRNPWKVIRNRIAKGHSRACEIGVQNATRDYLCLLNSDTVVTPCCWSAILKAFENDANVGVAGPSTSWAHSPQMTSIARDCRHFWTDDQICAYALRYTSRQASNSLVDLDYVIGFALFLRRTLWDELDGFDIELPDYGNETDLCLRAKGLGYRVVWVKNSYIHHFGNKSYSKLDEHERERKLLYARLHRERKWGIRDIQKIISDKNRL